VLRFGCLAVAVSWASLAPAQVPGAGPPAEPPPLDPPPSVPPSSGPSFLKTPEEVEAARRDRADREQRPVRPAPEPPYTGGPPALPRDFVLDATPWVDFSLTNFWIDERVSNFLNLGVQVGGYFFERMRLTARLVAPLEKVQDEQYGGYYSGFDSMYVDRRSRNVTVLYGASVGLIISNSKTFLFAPGVLVMRTDVEDYGTSLALSLPFEWTTRRHLRIGFELALGQGMGGTQADSGIEGGTEPRPNGTFLLAQFGMGFSMGGP
jgi:hypothetical protein